MIEHAVKTGPNDVSVQLMLPGYSIKRLPIYIYIYIYIYNFFSSTQAMQTFFCNNCRYQQHQCFVCGKLGSSDQSSVPEV